MAASPAYGQACLPTEILQRKLANEYNEHVTAAGVANTTDAAIIVLYTCETACPGAAIEGDGTFTLVIEIATTEKSCLIAAGGNWQSIDMPVPAKGDAT